MQEELTIRILLVEDDEVDRAAMVRYIKKEKLPYSIIMASDQKTAEEILKKESFDAILLDYDLKTFTGIELLPYTGDTPVIFITGSGTEKIAVEAMRKGASDYLIKDPERNYLTVFPLTLQNVMERKRSERALFESEEKLRTTLASVSDLVFSLDPGGRFIDYHQSQIHPDLYVPPDRFLGRLYSDVLPPDVSQLLQTGFERAVGSGEIQKVEYRLIVKEKPQWFEARISVRKNHQGHFSGFTVVARNITERKEEHVLLEHRVEEGTSALKESEERLNRFMESATEAFILLDSNLCFVDLNRQALIYFNQPKKNIVGRNIQEFFPDVKKSGLYDQYQNVLSSGKPITIEDYKAPPVFGRITCILKVFRVGDGLGFIMIDTTRRKKLEEQLRQAQKMEAIGSLAGGIAHDFNNILGIIIGYTELAQEDIPDVEKGKRANDNLDQVLAAAERAREMVKQILTFSRKDQGDRETVNLKDLVREALKLLRSTLPANITIHPQISEPLDPVSVDSTRIHQVIMNICANAAYAMKENGGRLEVALKQMHIAGDGSEKSDLEPGVYQQISFKDNGHGMASDVVRRIFEPYFTTKAQGEGTGMGLAVVHGILKNHGGKITVTSQPGKGTTFLIYLPVAADIEASEPLVEEPVSRGVERVLLVDDEQPLLDIGRQLLTKLGYKVSARTSSVDAMELFAAAPQNYDVVVSDQTMPNMTGVQLAGKLKKIRPGIPVILCTGFSEQINEENYRSLGIDGFVMKPIVKKEIGRVIRDVLKKNMKQTYEVEAPKSSVRD